METLNEQTAVYKMCHKSVVPIFAFNSLMETKNVSTGFITDIVDNRILVCTSAHALLLDSSNTDSLFYDSFSCDITGACQQGTNTSNEKPITVSMKILGVDMSADFAILYSMKHGELLGYNFSSKNKTLKFFTNKPQIGSSIYSIVNMYGSNITMINGIIADTGIIYSPESYTYVNNIQQMVTTLPASGGASGGPIIIYNPETKKYYVCGIIQWTKIYNAYTGGLNNFSLINIYNKICNLNITNGVINKNRLNFNGSTGKGYLGIMAYKYVNGSILSALCKVSKPFRNSAYSNIVQGILVSKYNKSHCDIPNSRILNAVNISEHAYNTFDNKTSMISNKRINKQYIILEINGDTIGDTGNDTKISDFVYYNANKIIFIKCLRVSLTDKPEILYFRTICDKYPSEYEYVSTAPDIDLIRWETTPGVFVSDIFNNTMASYIDPISGETIYYNSNTQFYDPDSNMLFNWSDLFN